MSAEERPTPSESAVREQLREEPGPRASSGPARDASASARGAEEPTGRPDGEDPPAGPERDGGFVEAPAGPDEDEARPRGAQRGAGAEADAPAVTEADDSPEAGTDGTAAEPDAPGDVERQRDEYLALAQRTQADFDNFRRRAARDTAAAGARAKAGLVRELLPALDNLERALAAAGEAEEGLASGVRMVYAELVGALERSGVASFEPSGEPFDPNVHEAMSTRPADGTEPGVVVDVLEKGYRLEDTVLRPARVIVSA